ncbi:YraN family protein [Burkholderiaceae bacterium DAT-1]|nr:YraN family protein [Burkholderiaceae bacterium DAT-1]
MNTLGQDAEAQAAEFLLARGIRLIARNWQCKLGELDLIGWDGKTLVFFEVRQRKSSRFGGAAASITLSKQKKLWRCAQVYLQTMPVTPPCRFDAVLFDGNQAPEWLQHILEFA